MRPIRLTVSLVAVVLALTSATPALAACPRTSLPAIEDEVMCPICGVPLVNAGGRQAENERNFIRDLVDRCKSKDEIKSALVAEYGDEVLAMPGAGGFDLAAYLVPGGGIAIAAIALAVGAARRRRSHRSEQTSASAIDDAPPDNEALERDLQRYDF